MKNSPRVSIVILNWNSREDTQNCIRSCLRSDYQNFGIITVDNASTENSESQIRELFPEIEWISAKTNLGYAGGNNLGIRRALDLGADFIWIVNPDVLVKKNSLSRLVEAMLQNPSVAICGPRILQERSPASFFFDGISIFPERGYGIRFNIVENEIDSPARPEVIDVDCVSGCSMLIRSDFLRAAGLFREDFFLYYEDTELSYRARQKGWRTAVCPQAVITHAWGLQKKRTCTYPYVERSRVVFAKTQKKYVLKTVLDCAYTREIGELLARGRLLKYFQNLLSLWGAILSGLITPLRPIPSYSGPVSPPVNLK